MNCLKPCPACRRAIRASERACPFCEAELPASFGVCAPRASGPLPTSRAAILFLGAATAGCAKAPPDAGGVDAAIESAVAGAPRSGPMAVPPYGGGPAFRSRYFIKHPNGKIEGPVNYWQVRSVAAQEPKALVSDRRSGPFKPVETQDDY